ncbi:hypothetical protein ACFYXH_19275 [Streptomyces sp. NPDC002730]|uniref:hypothetical protein n=1 Tax=unclassified Streptomyces TaxID=2593676 RepID=UPI002E11165C|nr:hypothetical protein OG735_29605 [Streptomyces sp. NBC_01210]
MPGTVLEIDTPETESGIHGIQRGQLSGLFRDADIALHAGLKTGPGLPDRRPDRTFGLLAERVETPVEQGDELLLILQFLG